MDAVYIHVCTSTRILICAHDHMIHKYGKSQAQLEQVLLSQSKQDMNLTHDWSNLSSLIADGSQMFYASIYLFFS